MTTSTLPPLTPHGWLRWDVLQRVFREVPRGSSVLEIGAGQGAVGCRLAQRLRYTGVEPDAESRRIAQRRLSAVDRRAVILGDLADLPSGATFDVLCAFEVLEHIEDDVGALKQWAQRIRGGGRMVLSVPLHQHRFGPSDVHVGHYRRYGREQLADRLETVGLREVRLVTYGFPLGHVLERVRNELIKRRDERPSMDERSAQSGRLFQPNGRTGMLTRAATAPFRLAERPFADTSLGTGVVVTGRLPSE